MNLIFEGNKSLKNICIPYVFGKEDTKSLIDEMYQLMKANKGIGLSAPQINRNERFFIMGTDLNLEYTIFNPIILYTSEITITEKEGCLSFPNLIFEVERPIVIKAKFQDINGVWQEKEFQDIWARCFLHEFDHLNGICFTEHISKLKLDIIKRKNKKNKYS